MTLKEGVLPFFPFTARIVPAPYKSGGCPQSVNDLIEWMRTFTVEVKFDGVAFGYSAGTPDLATPDNRVTPRLMFDDQGRFIGLMVWDTNLGAWATGARVGELKTVVRTADTTEDDLDNKLLSSGWYLCDGTTAPLPDLTAEPGFFRGSSPNWDIYTVGFLGI